MAVDAAREPLRLDPLGLATKGFPELGSTLHWRIVDGKRGVLEAGYAPLSELAKRAPWDYGEV